MRCYLCKVTTGKVTYSYKNEFGRVTSSSAHNHILRRRDADEYTHVTWNICRVRKYCGFLLSLDVLSLQYGPGCFVVNSIRNC